ncbi:LytR/AlgR family response regulator transcription factor [Mucilaginibacter sp. HD30]
MPDLDGLSFIPMLKYKPMIILTTAYDRYALKAYELEVKDYLVKPFPFEKFYQVVLRLYQERNTRALSLGENETVKIKNEPEYLFLKVGHRIQKIAVGDILFVEAMKDYLRIHMVKEKVMALLSFAKLEELLPAANFVRVHRSFMVAVNKIDHIEKNRIKIGEHIIPVSSSYADAFYGKLKGL